MLITGSIPNMIGGISQQAPSVRPRNTSKDELNTLPSPVVGNQKRPPFDHIAEMTGIEAQSELVTHSFRPSDGKRYIITLYKAGSSCEMKVFREDDGSLTTVSTSAFPYIAGYSTDLRRAFQMRSVGDSVFLLNRRVAPQVETISEAVSIETDLGSVGTLPAASGYSVGTTAESGGLYYRVSLRVEYDGPYTALYVKFWDPFVPTSDTSRINPDRSATVFIRQAIHNTTYEVNVKFTDGSTATASVTTPESVDTSGDPVAISTSTVTSSLLTSLNGSPSITATLYGSAISILTTKDIESITTEDTYGDPAMRAYAQAIDRYTDLAPNDVEGRLIRITGSADTGKDDYYVERRDGRYVEAAGYGAKTTFNLDTMPHLIRYDTSDGSFTVTQGSWPGRTVGDATSNADPTFVGRPIQDLFLFKNRMSVLADENLILSEAGFFESFYRTSLQQYLESDPIDTAATSSETSLLLFGVPFDETIILFSENQQYRVTSGLTVKPGEVSIDPTTAYQVSQRAHPTQLGQNAVFVEASVNSNNATLMEYYRTDNKETDDAASITLQVPDLIPADVRSVKTAINENLVFVDTLSNTGELYVNRWLTDGSQKILNSWVKWKVSGLSTILAVETMADDLYVFGNDAAGALHIFKANLEEGATDTVRGFDFLLDARSQPTSAVYDSGTDETGVTLPVDLTGQTVIASPKVTSTDYPKNYLLSPERVSGRVAYFAGDIASLFQGSDSADAGVTYLTYYDFSRFYIRESTGASELVVQTGRLSGRYVSVHLSGTVTCEAQVTPKGRPTKTAKYLGEGLLDGVVQTDGELEFEDQTFRFPARGDTKNTTIRLQNDSPYPSVFTGADWEAVYTPKSRRT